MKNSNLLEQQVLFCGREAKTAAEILASTETHLKNSALKKMADYLRQYQKEILVANEQDLRQSANQSAAFLDRLKLTSERIESMAKGLEEIVSLEDPVGKTLKSWDRPNGLHISRISVPLGVLGVIYESRPNVTVDAAGLSLKSGNAVILRPGSESFRTVQTIVNYLQQALVEMGLPKTSVQLVPDSSRVVMDILLQLDQLIDVIIPRGGQSLIEHVMKNSRIPVFKHLQGLCHTYIHSKADKKMAVDVVFNAKMRRPGICGATETILIDETIVTSHLPLIIAKLLDANCEIRGDKICQQIDKRIHAATTVDWDTEYLAPIVSVKVVKNLDEAIQHIANHGSQHTEAIITDDNKAAEDFLNRVDSAIVIHNASTQFADGGEFGMGAEMGIATGKLHARGPVGLEQLTTFKYQVRGEGQVRS